jgi:hypothetical protein
MTEVYIKEISASIERQIQSLLNFCESEIEKLFLLKIIKYISVRPYEFQFSFVCDPCEEALNKNGTEYIKTTKGFYSDAYGGIDIIGIRIDRHLQPNNSYFKIYLQKEINIEYLSVKKYRLDFFIEKFNYSNNLVKTFCIECDGHDFHSSKEQIRIDNLRTQRLLLTKDITTIRYSGSQINNWTEEEIGLFLFNL